MAEAEPGAAFINERLAAAASLPPGQRTPEASAFLECFQLYEEITQELPDSADHDAPQELVATAVAAASCSDADAPSGHAYRRACLALLKYLRSERLSLSLLPLQVPPAQAAKACIVGQLAPLLTAQPNPSGSGESSHFYFPLEPLEQLAAEGRWPGGGLLSLLKAAVAL
jgi:hypothetical protein